MVSLYEELEKVVDHRDGRGKEYSLASLLSLVIAGFLCGCNTMAEVYRFACRLNRGQKEALGLLWFKTPSHTTLCIIFHDMDTASLERVLGQVVFAGRQENQALHLMVDGKNLCGSKTEKLPKGVQMLACFCSELRGVLAQELSRGGHDEVTSAIKILRETPLKDMVVTADAMFTDKVFCETVVRQGGNYIVPVKGNQPALKAAIETQMELKKTPAQRLSKKALGMDALISEK